MVAVFTIYEPTLPLSIGTTEYLDRQGDFSLRLLSDARALNEEHFCLLIQRSRSNHVAFCFVNFQKNSACEHFPAFSFLRCEVHWMGVIFILD
ncbi:UNVERIFIED_CONTAM: hypothetical protein LK11_75420 [Mumia flava]